MAETVIRVDDPALQRMLDCVDRAEGPILPYPMKKLPPSQPKKKHSLFSFRNRKLKNSSR